MVIFLLFRVLLELSLVGNLSVDGSFINLDYYLFYDLFTNGRSFSSGITLINN